MPITFKCSSCKTSLTVPDAFAGKTGKCPKCGSRVIAPIQKAQPDTNLGWVSAASYDPKKSGANAVPPAATAVPTPPAPATAPAATVAPAPPTEPAPAESPRKPTESWDQQQPLPTNEVTPPQDVVTGARLTIVSEGRIQGCVFSLLTARCSVIGRDAKNEVAIPSSAISRHHCQVERSSKDFIITDLGSANGTLVNSERVISCKLKDGDYIQVGDTLLRFDS
ncbi:MAG: FHA domain-containing protein [Planctomycetota bacterium]|nr:FHA domain-containing protein [Planctomycetota bacterium]